MKVTQKRKLIRGAAAHRNKKLRLAKGLLDFLGNTVVHMLSKHDTDLGFRKSALKLCSFEAFW